jgi:hypothetical protein
MIAALLQLSDAARSGPLIRKPFGGGVRRGCLSATTHFHGEYQ